MRILNKHKAFREMPHQFLNLRSTNISGSTERIRRLAPSWALTLGIAALLTLPAKSAAQSDLHDDYDFHWFTLNAGGGAAPVIGGAGSSLNAGWNFQAGAGLAFSRPPRDRTWSFYLTAGFMFDQLAIKQSALLEAQTLNPTDIGLLEATKGSARFYSTTLDPTFRFAVGKSRRSSAYLFGGFGWLRRSLEFTGVSAEGALLQPNSPAVFGNGGNSGVIDAGAGINIAPPRFGGMMLYLEGRLVHGLAVNKGTTLLPVSAGVRW